MESLCCVSTSTPKLFINLIILVYITTIFLGIHDINRNLRIVFNYFHLTNSSHLINSQTSLFYHSMLLQYSSFPFFGHSLHHLFLDYCNYRLTTYLSKLILFQVTLYTFARINFIKHKLLKNLQWLLGTLKT